MKARKSHQAKLFLLGEHGNRRLWVRYRDRKYELQPAVYGFLLELIAALFEPCGGYLFACDCISCTGNSDYFRRLALRLRGQFGGNRGVALNNGCKSYILEMAADPDLFVVDPSVYELPPDILDPAILKRLKVALENAKRCVVTDEERLGPFAATAPLSNVVST